MSKHKNILGDFSDLLSDNLFESLGSSKKQKHETLSTDDLVELLLSSKKRKHHSCDPCDKKKKHHSCDLCDKKKKHHSCDLCDKKKKHHSCDPCNGKVYDVEHCSYPTPVPPPTPAPIPTPPAIVSLRARLLDLVNGRVLIEVSSEDEPDLTGVLTFVGLDYIAMVEDTGSLYFVRISEIETVREL